ncbi:MAG TPA: GNAT family N-acetyltransferase [Acidobacteriota bacterium]|nr:GNAT family N-acetyltransferase [Acidobacteriota bacterium]
MAKIDVSSFESEVEVRPMRPDDFEQVRTLHRRCLPHDKAWTRQEIESHLDHFPQGQLVVDYDGCVVASSSSLIVDFDEYDEGHDWDDVAGQGFIRNHDPQGDTLYGIEIMVDPEYRGMKLARRLYEARKALCRQLNLKRILVGGRIPNYHHHRDKMTAREYVQQVIDRNLHDPVLTTQLSNGFVLKRLLPDYIKEDTQSDGWATLLEWANIDYRPSHRKFRPSRPVRICVVQYQMRPISNFDEFAQQCEYFIDVASGYKADFLLFPELLTTQMLSFVKSDRPAEGIRELTAYTEPYLEFFSEAAIKHNVNIIGGSHVTVEEGQLYNIAYLFKRDGGIEKQYKLHITPAERRWWGVVPGHNLDVFETDRGRVAIQICYDVEFPEMTRILAEKGAQIVFVPFCTDERHGYLRVRYCAQARCIENPIYVAISGTVGNMPYVEQMDIQYAQSGIFTPSDFAFSRDGIAAECTPNIETVVVHDVDLELLERHRKQGTTLNWLDRRTDLYELRLKNEATQEESIVVTSRP